MEFPLCNHLRDYRDQFLRTESAYSSLLSAVHRFRNPEIARTSAVFGGDASAELAAALEEWRDETGRLRKLLAALVKVGRVVLPQGPKAMPRCADCRCAIHRFECSEWATHDDGMVAYEGNPVPN